MSFEYETICYDGRPVPGFESTAIACPTCPRPWPFLADEKTGRAWVHPFQGWVPTPVTVSLAAQQLAWTKTSTINPGDRVRVSINTAGLTAIVQVIAQQLGHQDIDLKGLITNPELAHFWPLQGTNVQVWAPNQTLPTDWPQDDTDPTHEHHAELTYSGTQPLDASVLPQTQTWIGKGLGVQACKSDNDCPSGQACVNGKCAPQQPPPPAEQKGMSTAAVAGIVLATAVAGGIAVWAMTAK